MTIATAAITTRSLELHAQGKTNAEIVATAGITLTALYNLLSRKGLRANKANKDGTCRRGHSQARWGRKLGPRIHCLACKKLFYTNQVIAKRGLEGQLTTEAVIVAAIEVGNIA